MVTALDIIKSARLLLNIDAVGDSVSDDEANDSFKDLNFMLDSWTTDRLSMYHMLDVVGTLNANQNPHTLGNPNAITKTYYGGVTTDGQYCTITGRNYSISTPVVFGGGASSASAGINYSICTIDSDGDATSTGIILPTGQFSWYQRYTLPEDVVGFCLQSDSSGAGKDLSLTLYPEAQEIDIFAPRFLKIERAFTRSPGLPTPVDFPMEIISSARYQEFAVKNVGVNYPTHLYYEPTFPVARLYTFPIQTTELEIHMSVWAKLQQLNTINDELNLPEGYANAIRYNLAVEIAPKYGKAMERGNPIFDRAKDLLRQLKAINQEEKHSVLDYAVVNMQSHGFQIYRGW